MLVMQVPVEVEGPREVLGLLLGIPLLLLPLVASYPLQYLNMCMVVSYNILTYQ